MTLACLVFFTSFASIAELCLRTFGFYLPLAGTYVFYASAVFGWKKALFFSAVSGTFISLVSGGDFPFQLLTLPLVVLLSVLWMPYAGSKSLLFNLIPGAVLPLAVYLPEFIFLPFDTFIRLLPHLAASSFMTAILLPLVIILMDLMHGYLRLPLYSDANADAEMKNV